MKQLPQDIRNRLTRTPTAQRVINRDNLEQTTETDESDEDGRQGAPKYFSPRNQEGTDSNTEGDDSSDQEGKGTQIDFEA